MFHDLSFSWHEPKRRLNIENHGYDFADLREVFDGRVLVTREDKRRDYGEMRYNTLAEFRGRIVNITFTYRDDAIHFISARHASREERRIYDAKSKRR